MADEHRGNRILLVDRKRKPRRAEASTKALKELTLEGKMRRSINIGGLLIASAVTLAGCDLIAGIFKAGVWVGVLGVIALIAAVVWLFTKGLS
jgi:hypothetical protein